VTEFGNTVQGIRNILLLNPNFEVKFVNKQANVAFYILAGVDTLSILPLKKGI